MARNINELHPVLQEKIILLKQMCEERNLKLGIGECLRSVEEQEELYARGRTKAGDIVTTARGTAYASLHQWGVAFDVFRNIKGQEYNELVFFFEVAELAKSIGLSWGGEWDDLKDYGHFYLPDWGRYPTKLIEEYGIFENFKKTWNCTE